MYKSTEVAERIKRVARFKNIRVGDLLSALNLSKNTFSNMKSSMISTDSLANIADYLNCSVDYLLGRTEFTSLIPENISLEEMKLISYYRQLNQEGQEKVMGTADDLVTTGKYIKNGGD